MGTTAEKLQAVLNSKNAIRDKFNLGDIPFSQYAENINAGGGSPDGAEFYKCVNVVPDEREKFIMLQQDQYDGYSANGQVPEYLFCQFYQTDKTSTGTDRVWKGVKVGLQMTDDGLQDTSEDLNWYIGFLTPQKTGWNDIPETWGVYTYNDGKIILGGTISTAADPWIMNEGDIQYGEGGRITAFLADEPGINAVRVALESSQRDIILRRSENWTSGDYRLEFRSDNTYALYYELGSSFTFSEIPGKMHVSDTSSQFYPVVHIFLYPTTAEEDLTTGYWEGNPIALDDGKYIVDDSASQQFRYNADNTLQPARGGIYDAGTLISAGRMYADLYGENSSAFYLCGYVNRTYASYNTLVVSGMPEAPFVGSKYMNENTWMEEDVPADIAARNPNGTYTWQNPTAESYDWYWMSENGCVIDHWTMAMGQPAIFPDYNYQQTTKKLYIESEYGEVPKYPAPDDFSSYKWMYSDGSNDTVVSGGSVAIPKPEPVEPYWEGYKLEADENGKYNLASEKTKLTYGEYMPVAGRIYDAAATVEITNADLTEDALWSCPRNMTSADNDEWVVSASSEYASQYSGTSYAYFAFDGNNGSGWQSDYVTSSWVQWQNKKRAVVIKQISFYLNDQNDLNTTSYLQGSDDGVTWTDIVRGQVGYPNTENGEGAVEWVDGLTKVTRYFKGSAPCYKYWRLGRDTSSNNHMNIRGIEAYSQLPREVPK